MSSRTYTCDSYLNAVNKLSEISYKLLEIPNCIISLTQILPYNNRTYLVQILYTIEE